MYFKSLTYDNLLFASALKYLAFKMVVTLLQKPKTSQNITVKAIFTNYYRFCVVFDESLCDMPVCSPIIAIFIQDQAS